MWLESINKKIADKGLTYKQIAAESYLSEKTVKRILTGVSKDPSAASIIAIAKVIGCSLDEIFELFVGTSAVVSDDNLVKLQHEYDVVKADNDKLNQDLILAQNTINELNVEIKLLQKEIDHKNEIIALHDFYNKKNL